MSAYRLETWIFDGRSLAWAPVLVERGELRFTIDLDAGRPPRKGGSSNKFLVTIRQTTEIKMSVLRGYLEHKIGFNNQIQEALNFLDHLIRQRPSENMVAIKRNFYAANSSGKILHDGAVVEVHKGTYASLRLCNNLGQGGLGLALNADVANTCFWIGRQSMERLMCSFLGNCERAFKNKRPEDMNVSLRPVRRDGRWQSSDAFKHLRKMRKLKFTVKHAHRPASDQIYTAVDFVFDSKFGGEGATARNVTFEYDGKETCVEKYYALKYRVTLKYPLLPLVDAGKGGKIPMELCFVEPMQRYNFKLNPEQTAAMIKIAVTRPAQRRLDIEKGVQGLQIPTDPYLKQYGIEFETQFAKTDARLLNPPIVNFGTGTADPKFSGRWDLRGKKFWKSNEKPLTAWGIVILGNCVNGPAAKQFADMFKKTFLGHGGKCTADALILGSPAGDASNVIAEAHNQICSKRGYTQLLFIVVRERNNPDYNRLKKSADCRYGILSQVVNSASVVKNAGQYHSNVCLKVNAKLGGATSRTMPPWKIPPGAGYFPNDRPTAIVGVDVSHAAPGAAVASTAAMTMSVDRDATRYAATVETNGYRIEMLTPSNVQQLFGSLIKIWSKNHGNGIPRHIFYFRDGVAEGQFAQVINQEILQIKNYIGPNLRGRPMPKFTVIIATKRHHIRFFPQRGDNNANPLPGTLVEKEVTHPFMLDFYLCSHVAIQGTARPVHYHVIMDEMGVPINELQRMIYHQCYSYARSTTPVSLHPAVYYAHLACNRARAHENIAASEGIRAGAKGHEIIRDQVAKGMEVQSIPQGTEALPLLQLGGRPEGAVQPGEMEQRQFIQSTMWYI